MMQEPTDLTDIEEEIDSLLSKANFYLQTYRAIDALVYLNKALSIVESNEVQWLIKAAVYRDKGRALFQQNNVGAAMDYFLKSYEAIEDGNDKAAVAGLIAGNYLRQNKLDAALDYAQKALDTAEAPDLKFGPFHIQGNIAAKRGDYAQAFALLNKAAEMAEQSHCTTDLAMIIMDLSALFLNTGKKETALSEIYRAERYVKECHCLDLYMRCALRRAHILFIMGKDEEAKALIAALDKQED